MLHMDKPRLWPYIAEIVQAVTNEPEESSGLRRFLEGVVRLTHSDRGWIYRLRLDQSRYLLLAKYDHTTGDFQYQPPDAGIDVRILLKQPDSNASPLEKAIVTRRIIERWRSDIFVPVVRGRSCLGVLRLEASTAPDNYFVEFTRALLLCLFERQSSLELLKEVQRPIDYTQPLDDFLDDILVLIADASRMPYIWIHEFDEALQGLHCIAYYPPDKGDKAFFDYVPVDSFPPFATAVGSRKTVVEPTMEPSHLGALNQHPEFSRVKSLVVAPIKVGSPSTNAAFGTLSFGADCPFDYSPLEVAGFESIANAIGVSINNTRNSARLRDISAADERISLSISGLEVAQAARHEVRGVVEDCVASLAIIQQSLKQQSLKKESIAEVDKTLGKLADHLFSINTAMEKIKNASRAPDDKLESASLLEIWLQARALVSAKLEHEHIVTRITPLGKEKDSRIEVLPDSLRHAFLHLLLNSIDAFKGRKKSDRLITISVDPQSEAAVDVKMRYTDNATGIDPSQFKQWMNADPNKDVQTLIFEKGVTTKPSGSGYGLYLVRDIVQRHHGSIELVNYRGGVVFDITLPKDLRSKSERKETR